MTAPHHDHYDHYSPAMAERLDGFFGRVDDRMNERIGRHVVGPKVLDIGCGFGQLVEKLRVKGFDATGIDMLEECVAAGKARHPEADLRVARSERLEFDDKSFDTVILKDTIHHIYGEADIRQFLEDAKRVCRRRIVVFDPNPTLILLMARKIIGHVDPVCSPEDATSALAAAGFSVSRREYSDVLAFPLSGGFVGPRLVPDKSPGVGNGVLCLDGFLESAFRFLGLDRHVCWRYLIVGELP